MPRFCGVINCSNRADRDGISLFRLPAIRKLGSTELSYKRRLKWLAALRRKDLTELKAKYLWICQDHFISGKPANLYETDDPDWVPSLNMGYNNDETSKKIAKYNRLRKRKKTDERHSADDGDVDIPDMTPSDEVQKCSTTPLVQYLRKDIVSQTETASSEHSASSADIEEIVVHLDINRSEVAENSSISFQNMQSDEEEITEVNACSDMIASNYIASERIISSEENSMDEHDFSVCVSSDNEFNQNVSSKKVQTYLTMVDLDKISKGYKDTLSEVKELRAKLKALTEDILHINEIYC